MHLRRIQVENWRMLEKVDWDLGTTGDRSWHVIVGPNGSGKSTLLRAISLGLLGTELSEQMDPNIKGLLAEGSEHAIVGIRAVSTSGFDRQLGEWRDGTPIDIALGLRIRNINGSRELAKAARSVKRVTSTVWNGDDSLGWYSASIGANRRFRGNDTTLVRYFAGRSKIIRNLTLFYEEISLEGALDWIRSLEDSTSPDYNPELLLRIAATLNMPGILPFGVRVNSLGKSNKLTAPDGTVVNLDAMSEGFKSLFAIVFEVLRGMAEVYGPDRLFDDAAPSVVAPGVVLVDEIDSHLHPEWQREIGGALTEAFPRVQWIVTTHSPFVAQHAIEGTILRLPAPDEDEEAIVLKGEEYRKAVYGDVTDSLDSIAFSVGQTRSDEAQALLMELAGLNVASRHEALSSSDRARQKELLKLFPEVEQRLPVIQL